LLASCARFEVLDECEVSSIFKDDDSLHKIVEVVCILFSASQGVCSSRPTDVSASITLISLQCSWVEEEEDRSRTVEIAFITQACKKLSRVENNVIISVVVPSRVEVEEALDTRNDLASLVVCEMASPPRTGGRSLSKTRITVP
jgi:hypothetical protein